MSDFGNLKYKNDVVIDTRTKKLANGTYQKGNKMTCEFEEGQKHGQQIYSDKKGRTRKIFIWEKGQLMDYKEFDRKGERVFNIKTESLGNVSEFLIFSILTIFTLTWTFYYYVGRDDKIRSIASVKKVSKEVDEVLLLMSKNESNMNITVLEWLVPLLLMTTIISFLFGIRKFGFRRQITNKNNQLEP